MGSLALLVATLLVLCTPVCRGQAFSPRSILKMHDKLEAMGASDDRIPFVVNCVCSLTDRDTPSATHPDFIPPYLLSLDWAKWTQMCSPQKASWAVLVFLSNSIASNPQSNPVDATLAAFSDPRGVAELIDVCSFRTTMIKEMVQNLIRSSYSPPPPPIPPPLPSPPPTQVPEPTPQPSCWKLYSMDRGEWCRSEADTSLLSCTRECSYDQTNLVYRCMCVPEF